MLSGEGGGPCGVMTLDGGGCESIGGVMYVGGALVSGGVWIGIGGGDNGTTGSMGVLRRRGNGRGLR
ncbi:hypothetical protein Tco_0329450 [Tanacetum coccineum]